MTRECYKCEEQRPEAQYTSIRGRVCLECQDERVRTIYRRKTPKQQAYLKALNKYKYHQKKKHERQIQSEPQGKE
jgi:hypothetical protein